MIWPRLKEMDKGRHTDRSNARVVWRDDSAAVPVGRHLERYVRKWPNVDGENRIFPTSAFRR